MSKQTWQDFPSPKRIWPAFPIFHYLQGAFKVHILLKRIFPTKSRLTYLTIPDFRGSPIPFDHDVVASIAGQAGAIADPSSHHLPPLNPLRQLSPSSPYMDKSTLNLGHDKSYLGTEVQCPLIPSLLILILTEQVSTISWFGNLVPCPDSPALQFYSMQNILHPAHSLIWN